MKNKKIFLCMDVGGTEIKGACIDTNGKILTPISYFFSMSNESSEQILYNFSAICRLLTKQHTIHGIRIAFPGPFDYKNGICLLRGLNKYDALYGMNLRHFFAKEMKLPEDTILFCNDVSAFALGELYFGKAKNYNRTMFLCIGTGCGSAFGINGRLSENEAEGIPPYGYVYNTPFLESCIDDYISKRGLMRLANTYLGTPMEGKELSYLAQTGNKNAMECFQAFGQNLHDAITPFLHDFRPNCISLGGQVLKSGDLFLSSFQKVCDTMEIHMYITENTSLRILQGLTKL